MVIILNKLHMLLLDDPLIGDFSAAKAKEINEAHPYDNERLRDFEARIQEERKNTVMRSRRRWTPA